jgi:hypothetical protein
LFTLFNPKCEKYLSRDELFSQIGVDLGRIT